MLVAGVVGYEVQHHPNAAFTSAIQKSTEIA
jgi:hypothetical protein